MSKNDKLQYTVEKETEDGKVQAQASDVTLKGLKKRGWTVVDDGSNQADNAATEEQGKEITGEDPTLFDSEDSDEER